MKYKHLINTILIFAVGYLFSGCSASTTTTPPVSSGTLALPTSINLGNGGLGVCADTLLGVPRDSIISIQNTGSDTLHIHSATPQAPAFTVVSLDSVIPPSGSGPMKLQFCPSQTGTASATLIINSNASQDSSLTVTLTGNGVPYVPGLHSVYTYTANNLDTAGKVIGSPYTHVDSVIQSGINYEDSSNVTGTSDSTYFIIEDNGDVSVYVNGFPTNPSTNIIGSGWQTLPFGTHRGSFQLYSDVQNYNDSATGIPVQLTINDSANYVETLPTTIEGVQVQASHVHLSEQAIYSFSGGQNVIKVEVEMYFSPDISAIVRHSKVKKGVKTVGKTRTVTGGGDEITLTSFKAY